MDEQDNSAQVPQQPNSVPSAQGVSPTSSITNTKIGKNKSVAILLIASAVVVLMLVFSGISHIGKSSSSPRGNISNSNASTTTIATSSSTTPQSSGNPKFASLFQKGTANLTQFNAFINQKLQSFNTFRVSYVMSSNSESSLSASNITYGKYFKNVTIDTEFRTAGVNTTFNEYFFNNTATYLCTNIYPFKNMTCFNVPSVATSQAVKYPDVMSALFGPEPPEYMNFVEAGQGNVNGQPCTVVIGNENLNNTGPTQKYTHIAKLIACLSNSYYMPLNFTYSSNIDNYGFIYNNYTEKNMSLNVSKAAVTKLLTNIS